MPYFITPYTRAQAKKIGVTIKSSNKPDKKIDVFKGDYFLGSIGAKGMGDYPSYMYSDGKEYAEERRRLYKKRHQDNRMKKWSKGWLADKLLW